MYIYKYVYIYVTVTMAMATGNRILESKSSIGKSPPGDGDGPVPF